MESDVKKVDAWCTNKYKLNNIYSGKKPKISPSSMMDEKLNHLIMIEDHMAQFFDGQWYFFEKL